MSLARVSNKKTNYIQEEINVTTRSFVQRAFNFEAEIRPHSYPEHI